MPGPTRAQQKLIASAFPHQVEIARPPAPVWTALDCYETWLAIRAIGAAPLEHHRSWSKQSFPDQVACWGFRSAPEAAAFRAFADSLAGRDDATLRLLRDSLASAFAPHARRAHST